MRSTVALAVTSALFATGLAAGAPRAASAATCLPNPVVCENSKTGTPASVWDIDGAGDETLQGFAADMSANVGESVSFKIRAEHQYTVDIYRLGYYGGNGARRVATLPGTFPAQNQETPCVTDPATQIFDCGTWAVSTTWTVPSTAVSGVYIALLTRTDTGGASHITFVVRDDSSTSDLIFKTSDATWQAYNSYGGTNFYSGPNGRATKLSYNRPFATRGVLAGRDFLFSTEYPMIRFLERNGYDVTYTTDVDADRRGDLIRNHKVFLSVGHDEYWSGPQRADVEAARDAGTSLAFFSGNEVYWKTRWEPSKDGSNTGHRTLVCYKETWAGTKSDPSPEWTGTWRDPRFSPPSDGGRPENALTGTAFMANSDDLALQVPAGQGRNRLWRNTSVANLSAGQTATLAPHTIGYESDEDLDNGFRPAGLIRLSTTTGETPEYLRDFGNEVTPGTTTHHLTLYRAASGALVFGAGTVQYAWGLDANHDSGFDPVTPADARIQQATVNLFADMGVQPATRMSGLAAATASTDTVGPTAGIVSPAAAASFANGTRITLQGTASDSGGGVVAGIEVSTDDGATWHPATGTDSWSYSYHATGDGSSTVQVRATDDSANIGTTTVRQIPLAGSTSLFGDRVPGHPAANDTSGAELGVKVVPLIDGFVKGVRFYKGLGNNGTHAGSLWSADGDLLAAGTFTGETETGWQKLLFSTAVPVVAGTTYVASYTAPAGRYAADPWAFVYADHLAPPLKAPRDHEAGGNGVYGSPGQFPVRSYKATNYYVDVLFDSSTLTPPDVTTVTPTPSALYVPVSTALTATFTKPIDPATLQFTLTDSGDGAVGGSVSYDGTAKTATFTPVALSAGQRFTASVTASDPNGNAMGTPEIWSFTTDPANTTIHTLFSPTDTPATAAVKDPGAVSVGVRFTSAADGSLIGVRFYKGTGNGGTHTGSLWSSTGARLATAAFVNESGSGWQTVYFAEPVQVTAGTTYVASYFAPRGNYAVTSGLFSSTWTNGPLSAPAGGNGVYVYGSDAFPTSTWGSSNYWVEPLFVASPPPPQPTVPVGAVTVFADTATPVNPNWNDPAAIEVGMRFSSDVAGSVNGVRFYKGVDNTGTHTGSLWSSSGALLATGRFVGETDSGWQTMLFSSPVAITANTPYVVSYSTPSGHYAVDVNGFSAGVTNAPLRVPAGGGSYQYGGGFPVSGVNHNYWVDVVFTPGS
ncbi:DUF4082 domain-containing protein [Micromonospora sp. DT47]|uniref:DUF4082 domain-containing protein n=1 Tax=Micromonospora sp. DT47 TaxID=3393431 RepID=UPI003CFA48A6